MFNNIVSSWNKRRRSKSLDQLNPCECNLQPQELYVFFVSHLKLCFSVSFFFCRGVQAGRAMALADEGAGDGGGGAAAAAGEEEEQLLNGVHAQGDGGGDQHVQ